MAAKSLELDEFLYSTFIENKIEKFTVSEVLEQFINAYKKSSGLSLDPIKTREWICKQVNSLVKCGFLVRNADIDGKLINYQQTNLLEIERLITKGDRPFFNDSEVKEIIIFSPTILNELNERYEKYAAELLVGESLCEEFNDLINDYPFLKVMFEDQYDQARNKNSKLLGQKAALKIILNEIFDIQQTASLT